MGTVHRTRKRWAIRDPLGRTHHNFPRRNPYRHKYHLLDRFSDNVGAIAGGTVRDSAPGPGSITFGAANSVFVGQNGRLEYTGASGGGVCRSQLLERKAGRIGLMRWTRTSAGGAPSMGWWANADVTQTGNADRANHFSINSNALRISEGNVSFALEEISSNTEYHLAIVLRSAGAFYFARGGNWGAVNDPWQLVHVSDANTAANVYWALNANSSSNNGWVDDFRVPKQLWTPPASYDSGGGVSEAQINAGITLPTGLGDFIIDFDVERGAGSGGTDNGITFLFRQSLFNMWGLHVYDDGSAELQKYTSGIANDPATTLAVSNSSARRIIRLMVYGTQTFRLYTRTTANPNVWTPAANSGSQNAWSDYSAQTGMLLGKVLGTTSLSNLTIHGIQIYKRSWPDFPANV